MLLGHPVGHSRSPAMHNAAFRALGLDWRYEAIDGRAGALRRGRAEPCPGRGFVGANVTIPHKLRALEAADEATEVARAVGAANTLSFRRADRADNTDVEGFLAALRERAPEAPAGMQALVLGAGGAARAVVYALLSAGAARWRSGTATPNEPRHSCRDLRGCRRTVSSAEAPVRLDRPARERHVAGHAPGACKPPTEGSRILQGAPPFGR